MIELKNISYHYPDSTVAIADICFSVSEGEKLVVAGANGAGKSTLFLLLNGILKPRKGEYFFDGKKTGYSKCELLALRQQVGIVFQEPDSQLFSASVYEEVAFGPLNMELSRDEVRLRVDTTLAALDIENLKDRPPHLLSYGQKKRVAIASVLAMNPRIIIFDEPTAGLDPAHAAEIIVLLEKLHKAGKTIIISTHDMNFAYQWAGRMVVLHKGCVVGQGTPNEVFANVELLKQSQLELPFILQVFKAMNIDAKNPETMAELIKYINTRA
jgi:cobalt/nickel transport system ATP-binding protein